ncbi:MAG TPA: adenosylcobalamin-dependent ribonucleoside-diphosphate reductase [Planctomycetota bacterium]|nr:adenosylcobalamin-dependent ribonucleoside-diphosphate reductase [Planctomycetota bacterium]HRR79768.1 adenosylcobalamin-dependent ribonucleoside-diphosphate reductase [Planctomycetota bacterium]HRT94634.1 adenosylcobalamin-dependent ribonucleoside-diphosphate reductase [Planctomycetota bacterium]
MAKKPPPTHVMKRNGRLEAFDPRKITQAILKAQRAVGTADPAFAERCAARVIARLRRQPTVEQIQDAVERVLVREGRADLAKAYILYRQRRADLRRVKRLLGVADDLKLPLNATQVLERRYLLRDERGEVAETPHEMFVRVARAIAAPDANYPEADVERAEHEFLEMMVRLEFLPNSPTLMNAGTPLGQLAACFVLPVGDSLREIFDTVRDMALIHQSGGGTGFSFSRLRPKGDLVRSTGGVASGPISFMHVYDETTNTIKQGGRRRGANMGILRVDHPDIVEFVTAKLDGATLRNFNLSVAVTDAFMAAAAKGRDYDLVNPRTGKTAGRHNAREMLDLIATSAWRCGDPGLVFLDEINRHNPTPAVGVIEATNPCGEQPLLPYEACNLGSINLAVMVRDGEVDWARLADVARKGVHFLDNVIDASRYPLDAIAANTRASRKIGLGVMGFAEALIRLGVPYDSDEAVALAERIMGFVAAEARKASQELGERRGSFPHFAHSVWPERGFAALRNATCTTVAPTGTISIIAGCSSGIEPLFALSYVRHVLDGATLIEENALFREAAERGGFYSDDLIREIARRGSCRGLKGVPKSVQRLFPTAFDIAPEWHVRLQAAFQRHTDSAVSKTCNLPQAAAPADVRHIFELAWKLRCKGITVYRYGSAAGQVLALDEDACTRCERPQGETA